MIMSYLAKVEMSSFEPAIIGDTALCNSAINGKMYITYKDQRLRYRAISHRPPKEKPEPKPRKIYRPPLEHPWKRPLYERRLAQEKALLQNKKDPEELALVKA